MAEQDLPTICEPGRHQNCLHTKMREKVAAKAKAGGKRAWPAFTPPRR